MSTELQTTTPAVPAAFDVNRDNIELAAATYLPLTIKGVRDKAGLRKVQQGRELIQTLQRRVERARKSENADAYERIDKVNAYARELRESLEPIAAHLADQEQSIARQRTQLERDAAGRRVAMIKERLALLAEVGHVLTPADVGPLSDDDFEVMLAKARKNPKPVAAPSKLKPAPVTPAMVDKFKRLAEPSPHAADFALLMHVANLVALIEVPQVTSAAAGPVAAEIKVLLANCVDRIRAAAHLLTK